MKSILLVSIFTLVGCQTTAPSNYELNRRSGIPVALDSEEQSNSDDVLNANVSKIRTGTSLSKQPKMPVRLPGVVEKVWVYGHRINEKNWLQDTWVFVEVDSEKWLGEIRAFCDAMDESKSENLAAILLDTYNPNLAGGTGESFDWEAVGKVRKNGKMDGLPPLMLAGGLTPENVGQAIEIVNPWGVDVSSGVEAQPGIKDMDKVEAFIQAVRKEK